MTAYKPHPNEKIMAALWTGTKSIELGVVPNLPTITTPKDAIARVTHCTICGSGLHMYAGDMNSVIEMGLIMGHEAIGSLRKLDLESRA